MSFNDVSRFDVYQDMAWGKLELELYDVSVAAFGGAIAMVPRYPRPLKVSPFLRIFSASGVTLASVPWDDTDQVMSMSWSVVEELYIILKSGLVLRYSLDGSCEVAAASIFEVSAGKRRSQRVTYEEECVVMAHAWSRGVAVLSSDLKVYCIEDWIKRPRPQLLHDPCLDPDNLPTAMCVIEAVHNSSGRLEVIFSLWQHGVDGISISVIDEKHSELHPVVLQPLTQKTSESNSLVTGDQRSTNETKNVNVDISIEKENSVDMDNMSNKEQIDRDIDSTNTSVKIDSTNTSVIRVRDIDSTNTSVITPPAPVRLLSVHQGGSLVAAVTENGTVIVFAADFSERFLQLETGSPSCPTHIAWTGVLFRSQPKLILSWENPSPTLLMLDIDGNHVWHSLSKPIVLCSEVDGVRVIANDVVQMIQHGGATKAAVELCKVTETSMTQELSDEIFLEISESFDGSVVRLEHAVVDCLRAAASRFVSAEQRIFLHAARAGRKCLDFLDSQPSQRLLRDVSQQCRRLRLLNEIRGKSTGLPLSEAQFEFLGEGVLLTRLVRRNLFELSCRICQFLQRPATLQSILMNWAEGLLIRTNPSNSLTSMGATATKETTETNSNTIPDSELLARLRGQLQKSRYCFSAYGSVAVLAAKHGRPGMVRPLLCYENNVSCRVGALLVIASASAKLNDDWGSKDHEDIDDGFLHEGYEENSNDNENTNTNTSNINRNNEIRKIRSSWRPTNRSINHNQKIFQPNSPAEWFAAALSESLSADDTQVAIATIFYLQERLAEKCLYSLVSGAGRAASDLLVSALRHTGKLNNLHRFLLYLRRYTDASGMFVRKSFVMGKDKQLVLLAHARNLCDQHASTDESLYMLKGDFEQQIKLVRMQRKWMPRLQGKPLSDTLISLLARVSGSSGEEEKLLTTIRREFAVPDKRWYRLQLMAYAQSKNWIALQKLANDRGSKIGFQHFARACIDAKDQEEALGYIVKIPDKQQRLDMLIEIQEWRTSADLAFELGPPTVERLLKLKNVPGGIRQMLVRRLHAMYNDPKALSADNDNSGGFSLSSSAGGVFGQFISRLR